MPNLFDLGLESVIQTLRNKTINADSNTITNIEDADIKTHTTTKISTTNKALLNSSIMYEDEDNSIGSHYIEFGEIADPSTPAANKLKLYMDDTDEKLKAIKSTGTIVDLEVQAEVNTASNQNTGGTGVFKQKTSSNLEFRGVNVGSNKITVTSDTTNNEIDLDLTESNLTLGNLGGTLPISKGGTGQTTTTAAFDALAPTTNQGDLIFHNGTNNVRLAPGTAGQLLKMSSDATAITWGAGPSGAVEILNKTTTTNTIAGTTTETSLYSVTIPANYLSSHGLIRVTIFARNRAGALNTTTTLIVKYGSTVIYQDAHGNNSASVEKDSEITFSLYPNNNSSSSQYLDGHVFVMSAGDETATTGLGDLSTAMSGANAWEIRFSGTSSETTTTDKTLDVRIILNNSNANTFMTRYFAMTEYIA